MESTPAVKLEDGTREIVNLADYVNRTDVVIMVVGKLVYVVIRKED